MNWVSRKRKSTLSSLVHIYVYGYNRVSGQNIWKRGVVRAIVWKRYLRGVCFRYDEITIGFLGEFQQKVGNLVSFSIVTIDEYSFALVFDSC